MPELSQTAIIGLAVGFGSIVGFIIVCCILWYCCCSEKDKTSKRKPMGPWMEMGNNNSSASSDTVSTKTTSTVVNSKDNGYDSRISGHKSTASSRIGYNDGHYNKIQKPLKAPYKNSMNSDMYGHGSAGSYRRAEYSPGVHRRADDSPMDSPQSQRQSRDTHKHKTAHVSDVPHSRDTHPDTQETPKPDNWYNVNMPSPKDYKSVKNNPELLYQRYLY